ncbi:MAG: cytochrome B6, partial [Nitrospinaceae bacterium]|nr:cytochrome B6 [Nitrospinaceae bacterium]
MTQASGAGDKKTITRLGAKLTRSRVWRSIFRHGYPDNDLDRMQVVVTNFFL